MKSKLQKIGIFSGTFDPVHTGHIAFARDAIDAGSLDRVYFMVERSPRRKQGVRAFEHRQTMMQLAIEQDDKLGSIIIDQLRFTPHETLPILKKRFEGAELTLIMGDDMLTHMHEWPHIDKLLTGVSFIIGIRKHEELAKTRIAAISSIRNQPINHMFIPSPLVRVSSSVVRSQLKNRESPQALDPQVSAYISQQGLYASSDDSVAN